MADPGNTQLVGFATTNDGEDSKKIKSVQPIYYSDSETVCDCLNGQPEKSKNTVIESEPFKGSDMIGKLWASGQLDIVIDTILLMIAVVLILGITGCCLCYWSSFQFPKRRLAMEPEFYEKLAEITRKKNDEKAAEYQKYKKYGIKMHDRNASLEQSEIMAA